MAKFKLKNQLVSDRKKRSNFKRMLEIFRAGFWFWPFLFRLPKQAKAFQFCSGFGFCSCCWGKNRHVKLYQGVYYVLCYCEQTSGTGIMTEARTASFICSPDSHLEYHIFLLHCKREIPTGQCRSLHSVLWDCWIELMPNAFKIFKVPIFS